MTTVPQVLDSPLSEIDLPSAIHQACETACAAIAPAWPLDRSIAVNPHWARTGLPVRRVAARMAVLAGIQVFPPRTFALQAWREGRIGPAELEEALARLPETAAVGLTTEACFDALHRPGLPPQLPLLIDVLGRACREPQRLSWREAITHQVSQTCAAYFDEHQADWQPQRAQGLYAFWRDTLQHDHGIGLLMGLPRLGRALAALPQSRDSAERWTLERLGLPPSVWADYLEAVLLSINGWASWCAYLGWQAGLEGRRDEHLRELLAVRLAWGALLLEGIDEQVTASAFRTVQRAWAESPAQIATAETRLLVDEVWQLALEIGYQKTLAQRLRAGHGHIESAPAVEVQAAFCIDVRSEPLRRALEAAGPQVQTLGFAGFFGLPVAYTPLATPARRPQLPGLLAPTVEMTDAVLVPSAQGSLPDPVQTAAAARGRQAHFATVERWEAASHWPGSAFCFVETAGLAYTGKLSEWLIPSTAARPREDLRGLSRSFRDRCRPQIEGLSLDDKIALATSVLTAMGLHKGMAPLVLLVGHGSQSRNNAHAAALDCGACCGQTGEVNARGLALLLNEPPVRAGLRAGGIDLPEAHWFVAALHNTTTDEIEGFDLDLMPPAARAAWDRLQPVLATAGDQVRRERAPSLGLEARTPPAGLLTQLRRRANNGAQTRPEWGLAGNASFLIAPRWRSRGVVLEGRSFLHDYAAHEDPDGSLLEVLMTAPMLVTHWINWQYHASTSDPLHLGSGNKVLHNVVGGHLGVFEGNGGDLRIGLPRQSLHDGTRWRHEPLRLTVVIDASRSAIETVLGRHASVRHLVHHDWLHLWRFEGDTGLERYAQGLWRPIPGAAT